MRLSLDGSDITLSEFLAAVAQPELPEFSAETWDRIAQDRTIVDRLASSDEPVYGLNTGLGANLGHRLVADEISEFQASLIAGRDVATGRPMSAQVGRAMILSRIVSAARGGSGISTQMLEHLANVFGSGLAPLVPEFGSIGAGDLTQNAAMAQALIGKGQFLQEGVGIAADTALEKAGLTLPKLLPKDAMALINHSGLTVALSGLALGRARTLIHAARRVIVLSFEGFAANPSILDKEINSLRNAPGQARAAQWFREALAGSRISPQRIQDAISFRTISCVTGAAETALDHAISVFETELNGLSDSPVVLIDGRMASSPNFHSPALALALENLSLAIAMMASGGFQRVQRMMNPTLTGLAKYLSPVGGASAGMVPMQKTAAALLGDIRRAAIPVSFDAMPVSDTVEDLAPMTPAAAHKLDHQLDPFRLLLSIEAMVAAQAIDLREPLAIAELSGDLHRKIRQVSARLECDRALGSEIELVATVIEESVGAALESV